MHGEQSLLGYIEDILYSYERAYPNEPTTNVLKYIKLSIPPSLKALLNLYVDFKEATSIDMLKSAVKDYDVAKGSSPKKRSGKDSTQELANIIMKLVSSVKRDSSYT